MESRLRSGLYLIAFLSADFGSQCDAGASVEKLRKLLHPVGTSAESSIPCSTRQRAASDGTPFFNMPNLRNLLRLCLPNSIISVRHTHFEVRASIISMMLASSLWRIFPLSDLLKSGTDEENSFSLYKILSGEPNLFTTFVIWLCASTTIESTWSSGLIWFITIWFATIKLRKIYHSTYLLDWLFYWKSKKWISSEAYYPTIKSLHELWTVEAKSTLTTLGSTPYKITTFLNEQRNPKWKIRDYLAKIYFKVIAVLKNILIFAPENEKGAIAQLVEQRTENPCVPGSIPGGTTQAKVKSLILTELAIFLLVTTGRSHYNSHYLNRYKPR